MASPQSQMLTANRLRDGAVVYWRHGFWVSNFHEAEIFEDKQSAHAALTAANAFIAAGIVVNPYLFPVRLEGGRWRPVEEREIVRSAGPSVLRDGGKPAVSVPPAPQSHDGQAPHPAQMKEGGAFDVSL